MPHLNLQFGIQFQDLYTPQGLKKVDAAFQTYLKAQKIETDVLLELAPGLQDFLAELFQVQTEVKRLAEAYQSYQAINQCKKLFIQKIVRYDTGQSTITMQEMESFLGAPFSEALFASKVLGWLQDSAHYEQEYKAARGFARLALHDPILQKLSLFQVPRPKEYDNLVPEFKQEAPSTENYRPRDGFGLTDLGIPQQQAYLESEYCLKCHTRQKDSCRSGLHDKVTPTALTSNPLGRVLGGCPLEQKVSEMMVLQGQGLTLAALAFIMIDNPLAVVTGHRICNDCAAACIFQKQEPVDIPGVESHIVKEVLNLPWGIEIYGLLMRWNPLRIQLPCLKEDQGGRILIAGAGPAGFTLAYYLLMQGHTVVNVDGLKIEPLADEFMPLYSYQSLKECLDQRVIAGFGGVAEYGITSRWDKNALKVVRLLLERFANYKLLCGVRFGSTLTPDQAFNDYQFDHVALCTGAGQPKLLPLKHTLSKGIRMASDFLMNLQLLGAYKHDSVTNLEIELPAVVIGGGLTAMDTATEILAYYPRQVERFYQRYQTLLSQGVSLLQHLQGEALQRAKTFIAHGQKIVEERSSAQKENRLPQFLKLLKGWGGVTVLYRQELQKAPAYRLNHEEIRHALKEGIEILEAGHPQEFLLDEKYHVRAVRVALSTALQDTKGAWMDIPAKTVMIAAGTLPNQTLFKEYELSPYLEQISILGDANPHYAGSVVKAIASAKHHYARISQSVSLLSQKRRMTEEKHDVIAQLTQDVQAIVERVQIHQSGLVEVVIKAPLMAQNYQPGQFYRLQNFATKALRVENTRLMMEGLALSGSWVDKQQGLVGFFVDAKGGSSKLCRYFTPGEPVVLMGPTGTPSEIPTNEKVCLVGDNLGNAALSAVAQAMKAAGNQVIYFAGFKNQDAVIQQDQIEQAADHVIWVSETGTLTGRRQEDQSFQGSLVQAMQAWQQHQLGSVDAISTIDRFLMMGSGKCLHGLQSALGKELKGALKPGVKLIVAINAPMQCMMKEICAQCLQRHHDPETGQETYIYSCVTQEQPAHTMDFFFLQKRLEQNKASEKLTDLWIENCLQALEKKAH